MLGILLRLRVLRSGAEKIAAWKWNVETRIKARPSYGNAGKCSDPNRAFLSFDKANWIWPLLRIYNQFKGGGNTFCRVRDQKCRLKSDVRES